MFLRISIDNMSSDSSLKMASGFRTPTQEEKDEVGKLFGNYNGKNVTIGASVAAGQVQVNIPKAIREDPVKLAEYNAFLSSLDILKQRDQKRNKEEENDGK